MKRNRYSASNRLKRLRFLENFMEELEETITNQTDVSLSLAKHVISAHAKNINFVFSPLSFHVVLSLIAAGSKGPTRDQLLSFLKSKSTKHLNLFSRIVSRVLNEGSTSGGPQFSSANSIWVDQRFPLKPTFQWIMVMAYEAVIKNVDFGTVEEAIKEVNMWVEKETRGLIKEILPSGSFKDVPTLILANALYFEADWATKFDAAHTRDRDFFLLNGSSVRVPFMVEPDHKHYVRAFDSFKVLRLPYMQGGKDTREFSIYLYLPDAKDGLPSLMEKICSDSGFINSHLPYEKVLISSNCLQVPKFKIESGFEASEVLKCRGVDLPFRPGGVAGMIDSIAGRNLSVSDIFQKSVIEVNERGTTAAAAAASISSLAGGGACPEAELEFVADHPFLFVVREDTTGIVLFVGQVLNPLAG